MKQADILVLGHPRGGTGYMAKLLQQLGLDVRHEKNGKHGTANWMYAARSEYKPWNAQDNTQRYFRHVLHVIREPISCIASVAHTENKRKKSLAFRQQYIYLPREVNQIRQAVYSYIGWHKLIKSWAPDVTVKCGQAAGDTWTYLAAQGYNVKFLNEDLPPVNTRQHLSLSYSDIKANIEKPLRGELDRYIDYYNSL